MNVYIRQVDNSFGSSGFAVAAGVVAVRGQNKFAEKSDSCHS